MIEKMEVCRRDRPPFCNYENFCFMLFVCVFLFLIFNSHLNIGKDIGNRT